MTMIMGRDGALRPRWVYFLGYMVLAAQGRFLVLLLADLGLEAAEIGAAMSVARFLNCFAPLLWGLLADRALGHELTMSLSAGSAAVVVFALLWLPGVHQFYAVMAVRAAHSVLFAGVRSTMDAYCLAHVELPPGTLPEEERMARKSLYGRERAFGALSRALTNLVLGALLDNAHSSYLLMIPFYVFVSAVFAVMLLLSAARRSCCQGQRRAYRVVDEDEDTVGNKPPPAETEIEMVEASEREPTTLTLGDEIHQGRQPPASTSTLESIETASLSQKLVAFVGAACCQASHAVFFVTIGVARAGIGVVQNLSFLFFHQAIGSSNVMLALSICITLCFEFPLFIFAKRLMQRLAPPKLLFLALVSFSLRSFAFTLISPERGMLILICEPLNGITIALMQLSTVLIVSDIAPKGLEAFAQGALMAVRNLGVSLGLVVGSTVMQIYGAVPMFRGAALLVLTAAIFFLLCFRTRPPPMS